MVNRRMNYQSADRIKHTGLKTLIVRNLADRNSVASSIGMAVSDKMSARFTRIKRHFDPLNIVRMLTGELSAAIVGRIFGRNPDDIKYFGGQRTNSIIHHFAVGNHRRQSSSKLTSIKDPFHTTITGGQHQRLRKGDGLADVLTKTYVLLQTNHEEDVKRFELNRNFEEERQKERDKWNQDLIKAIEKALGDHKTKKKEPSKTGGLLSGMAKIITGFGSMLEGLFLGAIGLVESLAKSTLWFVRHMFRWIAQFPWLKSLIGLKNAFKMMTFLLEIPGIGLVISAILAASGAYAASKEFLARKEKIRDLGGDEAAEQLLKSYVSEEAETKMKQFIQDKQNYIEILMNKRGYHKYDETDEGEYIFADANDNIEEPNVYVKAEADKYFEDLKKKWDKKHEKDTWLHSDPKTENRKGYGTVDGKSHTIHGESGKVTTTPAPTPITSPGPAEEIMPKIPELDQRLQEGTKKLNDSQDQSVKPIIINNSKTIGTKSGDSMPAVVLDNSADVRTDDPTLKKVQWQSTRFA